MRMNTNTINFSNKKIKKSDFYNKNRKIFNIDDIDVNKTLVSKKETYGKYNSFKYFIGCNDNVIRPLYLFISQTTGWQCLLWLKIQLLKKYNKIWKKTGKLMKINFNTKITYGDDNDKYIETKQTI